MFCLTTSLVAAKSMQGKGLKKFLSNYLPVMLAHIVKDCALIREILSSNPCESRASSYPSQKAKFMLGKSLTLCSKTILILAH